jgi:hypothetical protein
MYLLSAGIYSGEFAGLYFNLPLIRWHHLTGMIPSF